MSKLLARPRKTVLLRERQNGIAREATARNARGVSDRLQCTDAIEKGKPAARRGRKAYGPLKEVAGLPNRQERHQRWEHREWEPGGALTGALGNVKLLPDTDRDERLASLEPQIREALMTLERLEGQRGLSEREKTRAGALGMLLSSIERARQ
jgi:hypothetical protein